MSLHLVRMIDDAGRNGNPPLPAEVTAIARLVLIELALDVPSKRREARCSPSIEFLAERTRLCGRSIKRGLRILEGVKLLSTRRRRWAPNEFRLHLESLRSDSQSPMEIQEVTHSHTEKCLSVTHISDSQSPSSREPGKNPGTKRAASRRGDAHPSKCDENFERFWDAYDCKVKKPPARKAWAKVWAKFEKSGEDPERIIEEARWNAENDKGFRPYPASWLNDEGWDASHAVILAKGNHGRRSAYAPKKPASVQTTLDTFNRTRA